MVSHYDFGQLASLQQRLGGEQWEETIIEKDNKLDIRQNPEVGTLGVLNFPFGGLKIFPLWVGKKYNGIETAECVDGIDLNYFYSYKVLGIVDEKVPAGTFRCYKIELKVSYSSDEGTLHLYYSPQVKGIIKLKSYGGILYKWFGYSLLSYSLK